MIPNTPNQDYVNGQNRIMAGSKEEATMECKKGSDGCIRYKKAGGGIKVGKGKKKKAEEMG